MRGWPGRDFERSLPRQVVDDVGDLVFLHLRPHTYKMGWTDAAVRRYVRDAGHLLDPLNELVRCDVTTRNARRARAVQGPDRRVGAADREARRAGGAGPAAPLSTVTR